MNIDDLLIPFDSIQSATKNIELIVENILQSEKLMSPESLKVGLIAYRLVFVTFFIFWWIEVTSYCCHIRDHPPQDHSYVTQTFEFTSDVSKVKESLKSLFASGGKSLSLFFD